MSSTLANLPAASTLVGTELIYGVQSGGDVKLTPAQISTYVAGSLPLASGTYTPTATVVANADAAVAAQAQWLRVGNVVNVSGQVTIDPTLTATATVVDLTLPVASALAGAADLAGVAAPAAATAPAGAMFGVASPGRARLQFASTITSNQNYTYTYQYVVK